MNYLTHTMMKKIMMTCLGKENTMAKDLQFPTYIEKLNYDALDCTCCQGAFQRYFEYGIATGGFLEACIKNNLMMAMGRGDPDHISLIKNICSFIYNELPSACTGVDGFDSWCYTGGASQDGRFSNIQPNN